MLVVHQGVCRSWCMAQYSALKASVTPPIYIFHNNGEVEDQDFDTVRGVTWRNTNRHTQGDGTSISLTYFFVCFAKTFSADNLNVIVLILVFLQDLDNLSARNVQ